MNQVLAALTTLLLAPSVALHATDAPTPVDQSSIDRRALVTRHNITWNAVAGRLPLGNGEFCFGADGTGLQTFAGNSMSHWGWHSFPLPEGWTLDRVPSTGTFQKGRNTGGDNFPPGTDAIRAWMFDNPHIMNLGRLRLLRPGGRALVPGDISGLKRTLDLWTGVQISHYQVAGQEVNVETCVHPSLDLVAVRIESPLVASGELEVALDFPYPSLENSAWVGDFTRTNGHAITALRQEDRRIDFTRRVDAVTYHAALAVAQDCSIRAPGPASTEKNPPLRIPAEVTNAYIVSARGTKVMAFVCAFSATPLPSNLPTCAETKAACAAHWKKHWTTGGAIDLSASKDARWQELERRIVLSQYLMAAMSAGSWPSSENGLLGIDAWRGQFHMEMVWWHLAHYALWDRWDQADKALGCYRRFAPAARELGRAARLQGPEMAEVGGPRGPHRTLGRQSSAAVETAASDLLRRVGIPPASDPRHARTNGPTLSKAPPSTWPTIPPRTKRPASIPSHRPCRRANRASPATPCSISHIGAGAWTRPSSGGSAGVWRASRIGTRFAAIWRPCRWSMAFSSIRRNGPTPTPSAPGSIPIRSVFWACCRP